MNQNNLMESIPFTTRKRRWMEGLIDLAIVYIIVAIFKHITFGSQIATLADGYDTLLTPISNYILHTDPDTALGFIGLESSLLLIIFVLIPFATNGRSIGALVCNNRLIRQDGQRIKITDILIRNVHVYGTYTLILLLTFAIDSGKMLLYPSLFVNNIDKLTQIKEPSSGQALVLLVPGIISVFPFLNWLSTIFNANQLSWTDQFSRTALTSCNHKEISNVHLIIKKTEIETETEIKEIIETELERDHVIQSDVVKERITKKNKK